MLFGYNERIERTRMPILMHGQLCFFLWHLLILARTPRILSTNLCCDWLRSVIKIETYIKKYVKIYVFPCVIKLFCQRHILCHFNGKNSSVPNWFMILNCSSDQMAVWRFIGCCTSSYRCEGLFGFFFVAWVRNLSVLQECCCTLGNLLYHNRNNNKTAIKAAIKPNKVFKIAPHVTVAPIKKHK